MTHSVIELSDLQENRDTFENLLGHVIVEGSVDSLKRLIETRGNLLRSNNDCLSVFKLILDRDEETFVGFLAMLRNLQPPIENFITYVEDMLLKGAIESDRPAYLQHLLVNNNNDRRELQFLAASSGSTECLRVLLAAENLPDFSYASNDVTLLEQIFTNIANPEEFLLDEFDAKLLIDSNSKQIDFDFRTLALENGPQMHVLHEIANLSSTEKLMDFFKHPLIEVFLKLKWRKVRRFFYLQILMYLFFALSFSIYVVLLIFKTPSTTVNCLFIVSATITLGHAFLQILSFWKCNSKCEILMSFLSVPALVIIFNDSNGQVPDWITQTISVVIVMVWFEMMLLIGRLPFCGLYTLMFTTVLRNVIKVLMTSVCLLIGFALSFSVQLPHKSEHFKHPLSSLVKTIVMMMGEYEYSDLFSDVPNATVARSIFLLFILFVSIVLMNLMIGLTVNDINGLQEEGHVKRCLKRMDFLNNFEEVVGIWRRFNVMRFFADKLEHHAKLNLTYKLEMYAKKSKLNKKFREQIFLRIEKIKRKSRP